MGAVVVISTSPKSPMLFVPIQVSAVDVKSDIANLVAIEFVTVVLKFASSPKAAANSFSVSRVAGAESTNNATRASARASV